MRPGDRRLASHRPVQADLPIVHPENARKAGLEPLDWRGALVDMNENGVRDERESVEAAWRRLGLLGAD